MTNQDENARKLWKTLVDVATTNQKKITYKDAAGGVGIHHRVLRFPLGRVQEYCFQSKLPPLTILVVNKQTMLPGTGFIAWDIEDIETGINNVCAFNWSQMENPWQFAASGMSLENIVDDLFDHPEKAGEILALVKVRGMAQVIFRNLLLKTYDEKCAFCGFSFCDALEASHILPWSEATPAQRLDPKNGILLCSLHHRLFDCGYLTFDAEGVIEYCDPDERLLPPYCKIDRAMTVELHRKKATLPAETAHYPSREALIHHKKNIFEKAKKELE